MTYMRTSEEDSGEKEKECEGHRGWMTGGRAGMSSKTAVASPTWIMVKEMLVFWLSISLNVRFRFLFVSLEWIYGCEYLK